LSLKLSKKFINLSHTYEKIQGKSDLIWKNQRFQLIYEYIESPILPPPLNVLIYLWKSGICIRNYFKKCVHKSKDRRDSEQDENTEDKFHSMFKIKFFYSNLSIIFSRE
jgi:hypothetical protein